MAQLIVGADKQIHAFSSHHLKGQARNEQHTGRRFRDDPRLQASQRLRLGREVHQGTRLAKAEAQPGLSR
jgi:hypothetical protein